MHSFELALRLHLSNVKRHRHFPVFMCTSDQLPSPCSAASPRPSQSMHYGDISERNGQKTRSVHSTRNVSAARNNEA